MNAKSAEKAEFTIIIFGASGDLTRRKLVPSLYRLHQEGLLSDCIRIVGVGRSKYSDEELRQQFKEGVEKHGRKKPEDWESFSEKIEYISGNYSAPDAYEKLQARYDGNLLFYMAVPPQVLPDIVYRLGEAGLNRSETGWRRVIAEKPFGHDLESAGKLNEDIHAVFPEKSIFRIDHYLGKETVQNIMTFRFANAIFEPLWNRKYIESVRIIVAEEKGVGHRGEYYDEIGVLRDMFQNHLMQLLTLTALEPPVIWDPNTVRDEKVKVLRAVRPVEHSIRGQYQGYRDEKDVPSDSVTATFALLECYINNWRWQGIPFYLCSGKNLGSNVAQIVIKFKAVPHLMFPMNEDEKITANVLTLLIQPDEGILLRFEAKRPGTDFVTRSVRMEFRYSDNFDQESLLDAYERLLLEAVEGDASLFTRADEIELAWKLIDPILQQWEGPDAPELQFYEPGTWGPEEAREIITDAGYIRSGETVKGGE